MKEARLRPKSDYLHTAGWEELFVLGEHWQNDLAYYQFELNFFRKLINKHFLQLLADEHIGGVQKLATDIQRSITGAERLAETINKHQTQLSLLMENAFSHDENLFRNGHIQLENDIAQFSKEFRALKKELFKALEAVVDEEKLNHLLTA